MSKTNISRHRNIVKGIIRELYYSKQISCLDLSNRINKSLPNTMMRLAELVEKGIVVESGHAPSTGGRRPQMYSLKEDFMFILAVAADQFVVRMAFVDMNNKISTTVKLIELKTYQNPDYVEKLITSIEEYISDSGISKNQIGGIGLGMPGFIDAAKGINYSISENISITAAITERIKVKAYIDNDSSLIGLAEQKFGAAVGVKNAMVINIGWGVGLGLVLGGELFRGDNGFAGEFSHIPLFANNKLCTCGKYGCLETESSLTVIVEKAKERIKKGELSVVDKEKLNSDKIEISFEAIKNAALRGDKFAVELFSEAGYNIGRGVAILIHLLNPDMVVLSGRGVLAGKIWQAPIQQALNEHCIPRLSDNTTIKISTLAHQAELIGAAALVMEKFDETNVDAYSKLNKTQLIA